MAGYKTVVVIAYSGLIRTVKWSLFEIKDENSCGRRCDKEERERERERERETERQRQKASCHRDLKHLYKVKNIPS